MPTPSFCIDTLETTVARYRECVRARRCPVPRDSSCSYFSRTRPQNPIDCLSFEAAATYCRFRGKRLPWPNEWGRAAGGDKSTKHPWGNDIKTKPGGVCWDRTKEQGTCDVGTSPEDVSAFGVRDMAGNISEWTHDPKNDVYPYKGQRPRFEPILGFAWNTKSADVLIKMAGSVVGQPIFESTELEAGVRCAWPPREGH